MTTAYEQKVINDALEYVNERYLSNPYSDLNNPRGFYIALPGKYYTYTNTETPTKTPDVIYRVNYGMAHTARIISRIEYVAKFYAESSLQSSNRIAQARFNAYLNNSIELTKLKIACAFLTVGRENELRNVAYTSQAFTEYAVNLKKEDGGSLFTAEELKYYQAVVNEYTFKDEDRSLLSNDDESIAKKATLKAIITTCVSLDSMRHQDIRDRKSFMNEILAPIESATVEDNNTALQLMLQGSIDIILTGDKHSCVYNVYKGGFVSESSLIRIHLFQLINQYPPLCERLIKLSEYIDNIEDAKSFSYVLNDLARLGYSDLLTLLDFIEADSYSKAREIINETIAFGKEILINATRGRINKTVTNDEGAFWDNVAKSLVDPRDSDNRPELRKGNSNNWVVRLKKDQSEYEVVETDKGKRSSLHGAEKLKHSKHQSTTYSNYEANYNPPVYGYDIPSRKDLLVGISFDPKDCIFNRMMVYGGGTVNRPYRFKTEADAKTFLAKKISGNEWFISLAELQKNELEKNHRQFNEVMAGFKWNRDESSHITVYSDNLESRLLAQLRALDLKQRLEAHYRGEIITIPISIYPDFSLYLDKQQNEDLAAAEKDEKLKPYSDAIKFINGKSLNMNCDLNAVHLLLHKTNRKKANDFYSHFERRMRSTVFNVRDITSSQNFNFYIKVTRGALNAKNLQDQCIRVLEKKMRDLITKPDDYRILTEHLTPLQLVWVFDLVKDKLIGIAIQSPDNLKKILRSLKREGLKTEFLKRIQIEIEKGRLILTPKHAFLFAEFPLSKMKPHIPEMILDPESLLVSIEGNTEPLAILKLIDNNQFGVIMRRLDSSSPDSQMNFLRRLAALSYGEIITTILDKMRENDVKDVIRTLFFSLENFPDSSLFIGRYFLHNLNAYEDMLMENTDDICELSKMFARFQFDYHLYIDRLVEKTPSCINNVNDFFAIWNLHQSHVTQVYESTYYKKVMFEASLEKLIQVIHDMTDVTNILNSLKKHGEEYQNKIFEGLLSKLPRIITEHIEEGGATLAFHKFLNQQQSKKLLDILLNIPDSVQKMRMQKEVAVTVVLNILQTMIDPRYVSCDHKSKNTEYQQYVILFNLEKAIRTQKNTSSVDEVSEMKKLIVREKKKIETLINDHNQKCSFNFFKVKNSTSLNALIECLGCLDKVSSCVSAQSTTESSVGENRPG